MTEPEPYSIAAADALVDDLAHDLGLPPRTRRRTSMTVTVGPFPIYFGNVNVAMGLRGHYHTAAVTLEYAAPSGHGYPSFRETNDAIRARLESLTGVRRIFRDATNEVVAERLFDAFDGWVAPQWQQWGGTYHLAALHLDVEGVHDDIGHDAGVTRYTVRLIPDQEVPTS